MSEVALPGKKIKDILILDKPEDVKLVYSEKHNMILKLINNIEMSISDMARALNMNPGSIHYHLKALEKHGLVFLVREEIKGGVIKKYYRTTARRILLDIPIFRTRDGLSSDTSQDYIERLIRTIEYLGYLLPPGNIEDARDLLLRYDNRMRDLMIEMNGSGLDSIEDNGVILKNAFSLILGIKTKNDPELARIYSEFEKLFLPYE